MLKRISLQIKERIPEWKRRIWSKAPGELEKKYQL